MKFQVHSFLSVGYSVGQVSLGLLLHPYQTMQDIVDHKWFVWLTALPTGLLAIITFSWRFGVVPVGQIFISCAEASIWGCDVLVFLGNLITFYCIYWQILLLYLLYRFHEVYQGYRR